MEVPLQQVLMDNFPVTSYVSILVLMEVPLQHDFDNKPCECTV